MRAGLVILALLVPATASAGRTYYGWLYGTDVLPERGAELASWIAEENKLDEEKTTESRWWIAPLIGITDQLELAIPVEIAWDRDDTTGKAGTTFDRYGVDLRYRLVTQDPVDAPPLVPLVRVALFRSVLDRERWIPEANFVVSYEQGPVHVLADLGGYAEISSNDTHFEVRPGAGVSIRAIADLRFGAEVHAELTLDNGGSWAVVGPNMAWTHGRSWLSAMYGIGFYGIKDAPKIQWGIAF